MVLVLHKELDYKVEKVKYNKLGVRQPRIKNKSGPDESTQSFAVVIH